MKENNKLIEVSMAQLVETTIPAISFYFLCLFLFNVLLRYIDIIFFSDWTLQGVYKPQ